MGKFLTLEGDRPCPRRRISLLDVCGLGAPSFLTPEQAAARQRAQSSAWSASEAGRTKIMETGEASAVEAREAAQAAAIAARRDMFTPFDPGEKAKSIFAAYGLKGVDSMEAGRLAICMMAAEGSLSGAPTREDVEALGELAAMSLCGIVPEGINDEQLAFWKRLRRAFTPPAKIMRAVKKVAAPLKKVLTPKVTKFLSKGFRYIGATATMPLSLFAGNIRNKAFGLKGKEAGFFDQISKVTKSIGAAALTVVCPPAGVALTLGQMGAGLARGEGLGAVMGAAASLGAGKIGGAVMGKFAGKFGGKFAAGGVGKLFGKAGASGGVMSKFTSFMGKSGGAFLGKSIAGKTGAVLIKDKLKGMVMRVAKDKIGNFVLEKFNKKQIPDGDYEAMPDQEPIPITQDTEVDSSLASHVVGSGTTGPGEEPMSQILNGNDEGRGYPADAVRGQSTAQVESRLDPADRGNFLTPAQEQELTMGASKSELGEALRERMDQAKYARPEPSQAMSGFMDDEEISLGQILEAGRRRAAKSKMKGKITRRRFLI